MENKTTNETLIGKLSLVLSEWQQFQLDGLPESGSQCLLNSWLRQGLENRTNERYCNATWDSVYCWPETAAGVTITRPCAEVMRDSPEVDAASLALITGNAIRVCSENGTWLWGNWTNYNECLESLEENAAPVIDEGVVAAVRYILFIGSILSFICLAVSLFIFYYFKCLRCDRITVHVHLMLSMALRFVLLILVTEPFIFQRSENYRKVDWVCKAVMSLLMYATVASINWMFVQGHYLHGRLTTNVFDRGTPFKVYYFIGWVLPLLLILTWAFMMETYHPVHCWTKFSEQGYIWIVFGPMIFALFINLIFLVNIMRILLTKIQRTNTSNDSAQFRRAVKATAVLFPLLGINNLLFIYNPGGGYENVYMISNTVLQSSQGILVSLLYCFISSDVRDAIRREYRRFSARRSANSIRASQIRKKSVIKNGSASVVLRMTSLSRSNCPGKAKSTPGMPSKQVYFKSNLLLTGRGTAESSMRSQSPSPETGINYFQNDSPILDTATLECGGMIPGGTAVGAPMVMSCHNGRCACDKSQA